MKVAREALLIIAVVCLCFGALLWLGRFQLRSGPRYLNEATTVRSLRAYAAAQRAFHAEGYAGVEHRSFWREDIAGLYALPGNNGQPIGLIELSTAAADAQPHTKIGPVNGVNVIASPRAGYWFRALRFRGEASPAPDRYAACAYPDHPLAGKWMYIVSERGLLYRRAASADGHAPESFPGEPEKEGWEAMGEAERY